MSWVKTTDPVSGKISWFCDGDETGAPLLIEVDPDPADPQRRITYSIPYAETAIPEPTIEQIESYFDNLYGTGS